MNSQYNTEQRYYQVLALSLSLTHTHTHTYTHTHTHMWSIQCGRNVWGNISVCKN
jgi:hypothetical protein